MSVELAKVLEAIQRKEVASAVATNVLLGLTIKSLPNGSDITASYQKFIESVASDQPLVAEEARFVAEVVSAVLSQP